MKMLHIFRGNSFAIDRSLSKLLAQYAADAQIMIHDQKSIGTLGNLHFNQAWINTLPQGMFSGVLVTKKNKLLLFMKGRAHAFFSLLTQDYTASSLLKLILGPRHIVCHGVGLKPLTLLCLKLTGKSLIYIHWGSLYHIPTGHSISNSIRQLSMRLYDKVIVLMSPEVRYLNFLKPDSVVVQSYPNLMLEEFNASNMPVLNEANDNKILIGNSAWYIKGYRLFLSKCNVRSWSKTTFMLAYGNEGNSEIDSFIKDGTETYGDIFDAWTELLSFDEYLVKIREYEYYCCLENLQTGLGAIYSSIMQGKTVILRGDNYQWMKDLGIKAVNFDEIRDFSSATLRKYKLTEIEKKQNIIALTSKFHNEYSIRSWFDMVCKGLN